MRSNLLSYEPVLFAHFRNSPLIFGFIPLELHISVFSTDGGDEGIRTLDPLLAGQVLSQLSYTPKGIFQQSLEIEQQLIFELCSSSSVLFLCELRVILFQSLMFSIERR